MQFKHLIKTSVCALVLLGAVSAQAADDVYVDLSVLNNLQPGDSLFCRNPAPVSGCQKVAGKKSR